MSNHLPEKRLSSVRRGACARSTGTVLLAREFSWIVSKIVMILGEVVLLSAALGACCTLLDFPFPELRWPGHDNVFRDEDFSRYHVNSFGLIGPEPLPISDASVYRIVIFGDSFIEAFQVPHTSKFTTVLEQVIVPPAPYTKVEFWNFGHSGDNTGTAYWRWREQAKAIKFNLVLFTFNEGDVLENRPQDIPRREGGFLVPTNNGGFRLIPPPVESMNLLKKVLNSIAGQFYFSAVLLRNRTQDYLQEAINTWKEKAHTSIAWVKDPGHGGDDATLPAAPIASALIDQSAQQLRFVQASIAAAGTPVIILGIPAAYAMPPGFGSHKLQRCQAYHDLSSALEQARIPYVNTQPVLAAAVERKQDPYGNWEPGGHLNSLGHELVAKTISNYLSSQPTLQLTVQSPTSAVIRH